MSKKDLEFPGEPVVRVKDPSALEFPKVPRAQTVGVKHDLVFPEGEKARGAQSVKGGEASEEKRAQASETLEYSLESSEGRRGSGSPLCASPRPGRVFAFRALTAVAAVALVGLGVAAARPLDGRLRAVLAVPVLALSVVAPVVAFGARFAR